MKVPFGDLKTHYQKYKAPLDSAVQRVLDSGHFILGTEAEKFEEAFAQFLGLGPQSVVGCASGTEAIYLALAASGVQAGDEVIVVAHTAVPTISAISMSQATPVFVDIDPSTYLMDVSQLAAKITSRTKAIIPVHLYGQMVEMEPILAIAAKHKLVVIEDVAQATGATYKGTKAGTFGDYAAFSFYPSKNLGAFGDGGATVSKSKENVERLLKLRNYGQSKRYYHEIIGINSRLDELQAAILSCQLPYISQWNERRVEIASRYTTALREFVQTPIQKNNLEHVYHLYVIQVDQRDRLQAYLSEQGIQTLIHYPIAAHLQNAYRYLGYKQGDLPNTERVTKRILSLPIFPELSDDQIDYVITCIQRFFQKEGSVQFTKTAKAEVLTVEPKK